VRIFQAKEAELLKIKSPDELKLLPYLDIYKIITHDVRILNNEEKFKKRIDEIIKESKINDNPKDRMALSNQIASDRVVMDLIKQ
jgi:hypothetical protein